MNNNPDFITGAMKLLTSVKTHNPKLFSDHILLHTDLTDENQKKLENWGWTLFKMPAVDERLVQNSKKRFTEAAWLRMYIADHFVDFAAFYIDADAFLVRSISKIKLLPNKCQNKLVSVVYNTDKGDEFNSGVMFFNLERWRDQDTSEKLTTIGVESGKKWIRADQDVLNKIPISERLYIPDSYNFSPSCFDHIKKYYKNYPKIVHFRRNHPWAEIDKPDKKSLLFLYTQIWKNVDPV
ncbi:MAG: glycosyltransferase [Candidatus Thorarchaeota archaeon]